MKNEPGKLFTTKNLTKTICSMMISQHSHKVRETLSESKTLFISEDYLHINQTDGVYFATITRSRQLQ